MATAKRSTRTTKGSAKKSTKAVSKKPSTKAKAQPKAKVAAQSTKAVQQKQLALSVGPLLVIIGVLAFLVLLLEFYITVRG